MTDKNGSTNNITPEERQLIEELSSNAKAGSTRKRYASAMEKFYDWLTDRQESDELPISSGLVQVYLSELSKELSKSTLNIVVSAIRHAHQTAEFDSPTDGQGVKELMQGISRQKKGDPETQAPAMTREVLENIKKTACNRRPRGRGKGRETESTARERGLTDIALCRTLFCGMMRINEALDLCRSDIQYNPDGRSGTAVIRSSKTDQEGRGAVQWLSVDTMAALEAIRPPDAQPEDKIFRMSDVTAERRIGNAGFAAGLKVKLTGHSGRVGMTQELVKAGIHMAAIQKAGRWSSDQMVVLYSRNIAAAEGGVAQYYRGDQKEKEPEEAIIHRPTVAVRAPVQTTNLPVT